MLALCVSMSTVFQENKVEPNGVCESGCLDYILATLQSVVLNFRTDAKAF